MSVYKGFRKAEVIRDWNALIKLSRDEVVALQEEWTEVHKSNSAISLELNKEKHAKVETTAKGLHAQGIEPYKYSKGRVRKLMGYQAWFQKNVADVISAKYPSYHQSIPVAHSDKKVIEGIEVSNNQSPTNVVELYDRIKAQVVRGVEELKKTDKLLIKSIEYASANSIDIGGLTPRDIIKTVDDVAKELYLEKEVPDGTEIYLKHECYDCSTYTMGEHRCSCGNRRIGITVEGNLLEGYCYYPEAH